MPLHGYHLPVATSSEHLSLVTKRKAERRKTLYDAVLAPP